MTVPLKRLTMLVFLVGLAAFVVLVGYYGIDQIGAAVAAVGWGLLAIAAVHVVPLWAEAVAWRHLVEPRHRPRRRVALWARWIGEAVDTLLPFGQMGGEIVRIRLFMKQGMPGSVAASSIIVDATVSFVALIGVIAVGTVLVAVRVSADGLVADLAILVALCGALLLGFVMAQRHGLLGVLVRLFERVLGPADARLAGGAQELDRAVRRVYARRVDVLRSTLWMFTAGLAGAPEVWLGLRLLGHRVGPVDALLIESLVQAARGLAFVVPAALGVQEGGFLLVGALLGIPPQVALALALVRRVRELLFSIPGMLAWQWYEGRLFWHWASRSALPVANASVRAQDRSAENSKGPRRTR